MDKNSSQKQILKATGIVGGTQVIEILIRIARSKIIAVLLGPMGVGVIGLYQSTVDLVQSATGFGLNFSAVRDIAEAAGSDDRQRISQMILILRRWVWFTGLLGMVLTLVFCKPLSQYAFGDERYSWGIAVLSVVLLLNAVSGGQLALLQGLRKIRMMAQAKVLGVVAGFCITVPLYWMLGINGIVPAILISAVVSLVLSWVYSRKIHVQPVEVSLKETFQGGLGMVRLGFFTVISGFMATAAMYLVRAFVSNKSGIEGVGQFQAAWNLSSIYLAAVLQAMGADYFPRLSAVNNDNAKVVQLVNEQTEVALLVAGPLIVGMLSFMSMIVTVLYSAQFTETVSILHWQLAGTFLKVISWPIGFIILAKARGGIFVFTELCWNAIYLCLVYFGWKALRLEMTGVAFLISYLICLVIVYVITYKICGFRWSKKCLKYIVIFGLAVLLAFFNSRYMPDIKGYFAGGVLLVVTSGYSYYELRKIVDFKTVCNRLIRR
ncbi:MAG: O-antigen translocase [Desulfosporosinus sp.]|nr:O-antigen translocase [Desulfosporosinus sp.]